MPLGESDQRFPRLGLGPLLSCCGYVWDIVSLGSPICGQRPNMVELAHGLVTLRPGLWLSIGWRTNEFLLQATKLQASQGCLTYV